VCIHEADVAARPAMQNRRRPPPRPVDRAASTRDLEVLADTCGPLLEPSRREVCTPTLSRRSFGAQAISPGRARATERLEDLERPSDSRPDPR